MRSDSIFLPTVGITNCCLIGYGYNDKSVSWLSFCLYGCEVNGVDPVKGPWCLLSLIPLNLRSWLLITRFSDQVQLLNMDTFSESIFLIWISNLYHTAKCIYIICYGWRNTSISIHGLIYPFYLFLLLLLYSYMSWLHTPYHCVSTSLLPCPCILLSLALSFSLL